MDELIKNATMVIESLKDKNISKKLTQQNKRFGLYSMPYLYTNENLNGYYNQMDFNGKSVLTVVGSGDHILESVLRGATKVDAFDISAYSLMAYYLKEAAIKALSYEEYITYFLDQKDCFDFNCYNKIRAFLRPDALSFWDSIYSKYQLNPSVISNLFREPENPLKYYPTETHASKLANVISYFNREKYYQLRENLNKCQVNCYVRDVKELDDLSESYDYILLSNISTYQTGVEFGKFREAVSRYVSKLNMLGEIKIGYFWGFQDSECLKKCEVIRDSMNMDGIEITEIPSQYFEILTPSANNVNDGIIGYRRTK